MSCFEGCFQAFSFGAEPSLRILTANDIYRASGLVCGGFRPLAAAYIKSLIGPQNVHLSSKTTSPEGGDSEGPGFS